MLFKDLIQPKICFGMCVSRPINKSEQETLASVQKQTTKCIRGLYDILYSPQLEKWNLPKLANCHKGRGNDYGIQAVWSLKTYHKPLSTGWFFQVQVDTIKNFTISIPTQGCIVNSFSIGWRVYGTC
jgi:hypothetical protein